MEGVMPVGTVYLIHLSEPYVGGPGPHATARHYLGWAADLDHRIAQHRAGQGARLMAAVATAGIGFVVARTWSGGRDLERQLKRRHNSPQLCPVCRPNLGGPADKREHAPGRTR
jgi:hypothetical protein